MDNEFDSVRNNEMKKPFELFEELKKELEFLPNDEAKTGIINGFIFLLHQ